MFSSYGRTPSITAARKLKLNIVVPENFIDPVFFQDVDREVITEDRERNHETL